MNTVNYFWRLLVTALGFLLFAFGGTLVGLVIYPLLRLTGLYKRPQVGQKIIHHLFKMFSAYMQIVGICSVEWIGKDRLTIPNQFLWPTIPH